MLGSDYRYASQVKEEVRSIGKIELVFEVLGGVAILILLVVQ